MDRVRVVKGKNKFVLFYYYLVRYPHLTYKQSAQTTSLADKGNSAYC